MKNIYEASGKLIFFLSNNIEFSKQRATQIEPPFEILNLSIVIYWCVYLDQHLLSFETR